MLNLFKHKKISPERPDALGEVDLAFVVDTTGSMGPFISLAREQMIRMLKALSSDAALPVDLQVGIVEYRDHPPQDTSFVFRDYPFTTRFRQVQKIIEKLRPDGGGDAPEAVYDGLRAACDKLAWRKHSRRIAVLVGDAPPHGYHGGGGDGFPDGCPCGLTPDSTTAMLEEKSIVLYALGLTPGVRQSFSHLARFTGGDYFDAGRGTDAIEQLRALLTDEFGNLAFDRQVLALYRQKHDGSVDAICEALETTRGKVSASLSRLGRRRLPERD